MPGTTPTVQVVPQQCYNSPGTHLHTLCPPPANESMKEIVEIKLKGVQEFNLADRGGLQEGEWVVSEEIEVLHMRFVLRFFN